MIAQAIQLAIQLHHERGERAAAEELEYELLRICELSQRAQRVRALAMMTMPDELLRRDMLALADFVRSLCPNG